MLKVIYVYYMYMEELLYKMCYCISLLNSKFRDYIILAA